MRRRGELLDELTLRGERTIILTTNSLEEANILGDRVAALQRGVLRCYATPQYLKMAIDSGSRVNITSIQPTDSEVVTRMIRGAAPDTTLSENVMGNLVYNVPPGSNMSKLFDTLEANREAMDIESLGVGPVSLEEAFMKLCTDGETDTSEELEKILKSPDKIHHTEGLFLILIQLRELFLRQLDYTYCRLPSIILLLFIVPICLVILLFIFLKSMNEPVVHGYPVISGFEEGYWPGNYIYHRPLGTYRFRNKDLNISQHIAKTMKDFFPQVVFREQEKEPETFCNCTKCDKHGHRSRNIFDIYIDNQTAKLTYDRNVKYAAVVGLNVLSNIVAALQIPHRNDKAITMRFGKWQPQLEPTWDIALMNLFSVFTVFLLLITITDDVGLPCKERIWNTRYYHIMAGCPPWLYWLVTFIYNIACKALTLLPGIVVASAIMDYDFFFSDLQFMGIFFLCLLYIMISFYTLALFLSQCFNEEVTKIILLQLIHLGSFTYVYYATVDLLTLRNEFFFYRWFIATELFNPVHMYIHIIFHIEYVALFNHFCRKVHKNPNKPPKVLFQYGPDYLRYCRDQREPLQGIPYFFPSEIRLWLSEKADNMTIAICAFIVISIMLVLLIEYKLLHKLWFVYEQRRTVKMPSRKFESNDVAAEKEYIKNTIMRPKDTIKESVLVSRVWKYLPKLLDEPAYILKDINYSVRKGECFGFVGLNGSGKTSVFKAMTRQFVITKGLMYADGFFSARKQRFDKEKSKPSAIRKYRKCLNAMCTLTNILDIKILKRHFQLCAYQPLRYLKGLGYCPHSLYLDTFRTGSKNIRMLLCLRGIDINDVKTQCDAWQKILGLEPFRQILVEAYSHGMERRLSLGTAMCRGERVLLLDQPLSGVDVAARRQLWAVMERALANGCSIVHASHDMKIIDHMCNQLTILDGGEMAAIGSPGDFKKSYASGHSVVIKLRPNSVFISSGAARVQALKDFMYQEFNCFLRDDNLVHLYFIITERLRYSIIHEKLTSMINEFKDIIEEYSAYDSHFEDAFIQFVNDSRYSVKPNETW